MCIRDSVYGVTFEQGRNELKIGQELLSNVVTQNKDLPENAKIDLLISLITLKYTQSNSVCYVKDGQAIGDVYKRQAIRLSPANIPARK